MRGGAKLWTQEEDEFLLQNENELTDADIAELLGRTEKAIWMHRNKLRKEGKYEGHKTKIREGNKMNVAFDQISCADAAKMLGVDYSTVVAWCRKGVINADNLSDGTRNGRWQIADDEVNYIMGLKDKFGSTRAAMMHYRKNWKEGNKPVEPKPVEPKQVPVEPKEVVIRDYVPSNQPIEKKETSAEDLITTISYLREVKKRIADCKEELALLKEEYENLRNEVIDAL